MRSCQHGYGVFDPDDLEGLYEYLKGSEVVDGPDELRDIVADNWLHLLHKVKPPLRCMH